ncbi:hypothetical protein AB6A40_009966 [Gnathostoma spinigerum]|uniref:SAC3/GANP/THP3 conserved domain-containing protein n=1 Tax=Gnathostoma spinigerum TaxID=75299 RepID=A0ABD6F1U0_9BILA
MKNSGERVRFHARCMGMCPVAEVAFRRKNNLIHILETDAAITLEKKSSCDEVCETSRAPKCNPNRMVKEYTRSAAGRGSCHPESVRPYPVLLNTVRYLLGLQKENVTVDWATVYGFICDRLRAVRFDMTVQRMNVENSLSLLETMIPFYISTFYECERNPFPTYDRHLHMQQLKECFSLWRASVDRSTSVDIRIAICFLLWNALAVESLALLHSWKVRLPIELSYFVEDVILSIRMNNFVRFFRLLEKQADPLISC